MEDCKFSPRELDLAVEDLAAMRYFPQDSRAAVAAELARMVPHKRALDWLVLQCRTRISEWPGLAELRGVLCWKFDAADGIDAYSKLPGFRPTDGEEQSYAEHQQLKSQEKVNGRGDLSIDLGRLL